MLGLLALLLAIGAAGWFLFRVARGEGAVLANDRTDFLFKGAAFLAIVAVLGAVKLWPLAFMVFLAAAGVMGTELWRARVIRSDQHSTTLPEAPLDAKMKPEEAASILGVDLSASEEEIKTAHKKLIGQVHPDKGGTNYLAAKINDARETMLTAIPSAKAEEGSAYQEE